MAQIESLRTENKFKKIGCREIPVDWGKVKLDELIKLNYGEGLPEAKREEGDYPVFGSNGIIGYHNNFLVKGPAIIIGRKGTIGSVTWSDSNFWPIDTTYYVEVKDRLIDLKWLYYQLVDLKLNKLNSATGIPGLNREVALSIELALPPSFEQKKIAQILSSVDQAIEKSVEIIERTKQLKKGLLQELLTRGIGHKKFKKTRIGEIPHEWQVVKIGEVCEVVGGSTPDTTNKQYWDGQVLWAVPTDITRLKTNSIDDTERKITEEGLANCAAKLLPSGSILLTSRATIGRCAVNTHPMATNQGFASLVCKEKIYNWYMFYSMTAKRPILEKLSSGSTFKEISKKSVRNLIVVLPPISEQKQIADILSSVDEQIEKETSRKKKLEALKKGLMQVLLTGKVRVRI